MSIFKVVSITKSDAKADSFYRHGVFSSLSISVGTLIYGLLTHMSGWDITERIFFQTFAILFFCFMMNRTHHLYRKNDAVETQVEIKKQKLQAEDFNFKEG